MNALLITGTDPGVGKTLLMKGLMAYCQAFAADRPLQPLDPIPTETTGVDLSALWSQFSPLLEEGNWVLLEAEGGFGSAITKETTVADLAWDWRIPTVLVVPVRPGAVGQAVAHAALARQARAYLRGIVLNCVQPCSPKEREQWADLKLIRSLTHVPVLGYLPHLTDPGETAQLVSAIAGLELEHLALV